eukprot:COSAG05_NODE_406_length_10149_cov_13.684478_5_plen_48_part_00
MTEIFLHKCLIYLCLDADDIWSVFVPLLLLLLLLLLLRVRVQLIGHL